jgi:glyoxylase-like metal-dependent hydrolase (beta-lactamase superfamily II)
MSRLIDLGDDIFAIEANYGDVFVRTYVVKGERMALVDTGINETGDIFLDLWKFMDKPQVDVLLHTHGHWDHIGAATRIKDETSARVAIHGDDAMMMASYAENDRRFLYAFDEFPPTDEDVENVYKYIGKETKADILINDGDVFDISNRTLEAIAIPGHTSGCVAFFDESTGTLFTGDGLCGDGPFGTLIQYEDVDGYRVSVEKIIKLAPNRILTGHFEPICGGSVADFLKTCLNASDEVHATVKDLSKVYDDLYSLTKATCEKLGRPFLLQPFFTVTAHLEALKKEEN